MKTKHRITVNLEENEYHALQKIAAGTERSLAWLGRKAICDLIGQNEKRVITSGEEHRDNAFIAGRAAQ